MPTSFRVIKNDLVHILQQIKIAELHGGRNAPPVALTTAIQQIYGVNAETAALSPFGLRTVDGSENNLLPGQSEWGAADNPFPRLTDPVFSTVNGPGIDFNGDGLVDVINHNYGDTNGSAPGGIRSVVDADPRTISNLIVDMTVSNPAAIDAFLNNPLSVAAFEAEMGFAPTEAWLTNPANETAANAQLSNIPNQSPDIGLSPGFNSWMTFFGQFFDHGLDLVTKGKNGTVYIPLQADDQLYDKGKDGIANNVVDAYFVSDPALSPPGQTPAVSGTVTAWQAFYVTDPSLTPVGAPPPAASITPTSWAVKINDDGAGADGIFGTTDDSPNFMALTRATVTFDANGVPQHENTTTSFVDQNQTYTSHASHQAFLREYVREGGATYATGKLLSGTGANNNIEGAIGNWADVKDSAIANLGLMLSDKDVHDVPLLKTDQYGRIIANANGYAEVAVLVTIVNATTGATVSTVGNTFVAGVDGGLDIHALTFANLPGSFTLPPLGVDQAFKVAFIGTGHAFLNDIAHHAAPGTYDHDGNPATAKVDQVADSDPGVGDDGDASTYDDEMLESHFITGDGRGNENIGLTSVHSIFHSEHDRLVDDNKATILASADLAFINEWLRVDITDLAEIDTQAEVDALKWDGERLFQAARFVTEMQYQHMVFEEFARRIAPTVNPFVFTNSADIDPDILAEFAHTVYRFGHSMLTDSVDRLENDLTTVNGDADQSTLLEAFLNPQMYLASGADLDAINGAIVRGTTRDVGNEIDEFVVNELRNTLVGLPLDLAALNIARGRETGVPSLNETRRQLFEDFGAPDLKPYTSWIDFAQHLKTPMSIINFIAAYGTHEAVVNATTLTDKRDAATLLLFGDGSNANGVTIGTVTYTNADRMAFLNGTDGYTGSAAAGAAGSMGGMNHVDLWIGGLAEELNEFGGMLGSTFDFIFQYQLEHLQNGDRFYYLSRTQGMNLLNQLEPNTFTDIVQRNSDLGDDYSTHLNGALFTTPDHILELDRGIAQEGADPEWDSAIQQIIDPKVVRDYTGASTINVDGVDHDVGGFLQYSGGEHVVLGGTEGNDTLLGDKGIDTLWGDGGDDYLNAGMESDQVFGGDGDDVIVDPFGDDFLRGGLGNDVISGGQGLDLLFGEEGKDVLILGQDDAEIFAGTGDDFLLGGAGNDFLLGNEGSDWIEGGEGFDGIAGDNSELFFNSQIIGHDVLNGNGNDTDYDGETGDDIMIQGAGIQRNNGMAGFDWAIHKGDPNAANSDLGKNIFNPGANGQADLILRDRFDLVEGLSGWKFNDNLIGRDIILGGAGAGAGGAINTATDILDSYSNALLEKNVHLIDGLADLVAHLTRTTVTVAGITETIVLDPQNAEDMLLGGGGSDFIRGGGGNDIIDGDKWLNVRIRINDTSGNEMATADSLNGKVYDLTGAEMFGGRPLQAIMLDRTLNPEQLVIAREILNGEVVGDVDVASYGDVVTAYDFVRNTDGSITVIHSGFDILTTPPGPDGQPVDDGTDRVWNVEQFRFSDGAGGTVTFNATALDTVPVVSTSDVTVVEGTGGTQNAVFTVTLSDPSIDTVEIDFAFANGTALAGSDYTGGTGTVVFSPGQTTRTITVPVATDSIDEFDETFTVTLSNPTNAFVPPAEATMTATIIDDDAAPSMSVVALNIVEGNTGVQTATVTVNLSGPSGKPVAINYATADGTATSGGANSDYIGASGQLNFAPGETSKTFTFQVAGDLANEANETVQVNLTSNDTSNATATADAAIIDNDGMPVLSVGNLTITEGDAGTQVAQFQVYLSPASQQTVTVNYGTANGTAVAGQDYTATTGSLSFAPGETMKTVSVPVVGDTVFESTTPSEYFSLNLTGAANASIQNNGIGFILDNDALPVINVTDQTVFEGNNGSSFMIFTVTLSGSSDQMITVNYATIDNTATGGSDFGSQSGLLTFAPGQTSRTVAVPINGDVTFEDTENFTLSLTNAVNSTLGSTGAIGTITNDDAAPSLSISPVTITEGDSGSANATVTITLGAPSQTPVLVVYQTSDGTATSGVDYASTTGSVIFAPGTTSMTVNVPVNGDLLDEVDENFVFSVSSADTSNGSASTNVTIVDNDSLPSLSISDASVAEGDAGTSILTYTVTLSAVSSQAISVAYASSDGTASAGSDYTAASGVLNFAPGETSHTVTLIVSGDTLHELNETANITLSDPVNAVISDGSGVGTIINDDAAPTMSAANVSITEGNSGTANAVMTITLSGASSQPVVVNYATANGTAAGDDYTATSGSVTFAPGVTAMTVNIPVSGDVLNEASDTVLFNLTSSETANASASATLTIDNDDPLPSLSIGDVTIVEGTGGTQNAVFTVSLNQASGLPITIDFTTGDGTAVAGSDYGATSGSLSFAPGQTTQTVTVPIASDNVDEANETFTVSLQNAVNAIVSAGTATATINDDDGAPNMSVANVTMVEGNSGSSNAVMTITLSNPSSQPVVVNYATADGTATGDDYSATSGSVTFAPGVTTMTVQVPVSGDVLNETDDTVLFNLSSSDTANASATATLTITNDDAQPVVSIGDVTIVEGTGGTQNAVFTISLNQASGLPVSIDYVTDNGTALAGQDYTASGATLNFAPGQTTQTVTVPITTDSLDEFNETFSVSLQNAVNAVASPNVATALISDDDAPPSMSVAELSIVEGDSGSQIVTATVTLNALSGKPVTINYATADGTAIAGSDYTAASGSLTFAPGETSKTFTFLVSGDVTNEVNEMLALNLTSSDTFNATTSATATIVDNDGVPVLSVGNLTITEGDAGTQVAQFQVYLSPASQQTVTVNYGTANGTAVAGQDYTATTGSLSFAPGETMKTVSVPVVGDTVFESTTPSEYFSLNLTGAANASIQNNGIGFILDNDALPVINVTDQTVFEGNNGSSFMIFTVTLSGSSDQMITVNYATIDNTATGGSDFGSQSGLLTFAPGQTSRTVAVPINGDVTFEDTENFTLSLTNAVNSTLGSTGAIGTITNDDAAPSLSISPVTITEGDSGSANATVTITLGAPSQTPVLVVYQTSDGTATSGVDYASTTGSVIFAPGTTSMTVNVPVNGDLLDEVDENFVFSVSSADTSNGSASTNVTIVDNDSLPSLSISDASVAEGDAGTSILTYTVTLSAVSSQAISVAYASSDGTASAGSDYTAASGVLNFAPGETSHTVTLIVSGDTLHELNETANITLSDPVNAVISDGSGVGTIINDDAAPTMSAANVSITEGNSGTANAVMTITLSGASSQPVVVNYATANGTAAGDDYTATSGSVTFAPGVTAMTVNIPVSGDVLNEASDTVLFNLTSSETANASASATLTIDNDDPLPSLSIGDVTIVEGTGGTQNAVFTVSLNQASGLPITIDFTTGDGTAVAGSDYGATSGSLSFAPGQTTQTVTVPIASDNVDEANETFTVSLQNAVNAIVSAGTATATINDDDGAPNMSVANVTMVEGNSGSSNAVMTITLSNPSSQPVVVNYATADGTATGDDYSATSGSVTFAPGVTTMTVQVPVSGDVLNETDDTVLFNLSSSDTANASATATLTITNDDAQPVVSIGDVTIVEGTGGTQNAVFTISLNQASGLPVSIDYVTDNGTALAGQDYTASGATLNFAPGQTTQTVTVPITTDSLDEFNETFSVSLQNAVNAVASPNVATALISDDDAPPSMSVAELSIVEGDSGSQIVTATVTLNALSGKPVTINYATADGTAIAGSDYTAASGSLTFAPGETSKTFTFLVSGDVTNEVNEMLALNLTSSDTFNATTSATATIVDNDGVPVLSVGNLTITEGDAGTQVAQFQVYLSPASQQTVTVNYGTANGTAVAGQDYTATTGSLSFAPGETMKTVSVPVVGDTVFESTTPSEYFSLNLTGAANASIQNNGIGFILDNDALPVINVTDQTVFEGNNGSSFMIFTVTLSGSSDQMITVNYATIDNTATGGSDFGSQSGLLTFAPGQTSRTVAVPINGDVTFEDTENFTLSLTNAVNSTLGSTGAIGTITNDDAAPSLSISPVTITEGDSGSANATVTITLGAPSALPIVVDYQTSEGTATDGVDYAFTTGSVTFVPGTTTMTVNVPVNADLLDEINEDLVFSVSSADTSNTSASTNITILDNDPLPGISISDATVAEGDAGTAILTYTVSLSAPSSKAISVNYASADGSADGSDYTANSGTLNFAPGETSHTVSLIVSGDTLHELNETASITLSAPVNAVISDDSGVGTITNDDAAPVLSIGTPVAVIEGGVAVMQFSVTLSAVSALPVSFAYATADGSAIAGSDYTAASGAITIPAGQLGATISVPILNDNVFELAESFSVGLSGISGATAGTVSATGTINNDDAVPAISVGDVTIVEGNAGTSNMVFTLTLSNPSAQAVSVNYATAAGTATAGSDYASLTGTATFAPGATTALVSIVINGDTAIEVNETLSLNLSSAVNATIATASVTGTITNDDFGGLNVIFGTTASETITGTGAADLIYGSSGDDVVNGMAANDVLFGEAGNDMLRGGPGNDVIDGGTGTDTILYTGGGAIVANLAASTVFQTVLTTGTANGSTPVQFTDTLISIENVVGSQFGDSLTGNGGNNVFTPGAGADVLIGGGGVDTLDYSSATGAVFINLSNDTVSETSQTTGTFQIGAAMALVSTDTANGFSNVIGSQFGDRIRLHNGDNAADAGAGDDFIGVVVTNGRDFIDGGSGTDTFQVNGTAAAETFNIYTRNAWLAVAGNSAASLNANTEIVITRDGSASANIVVELDNIEEITVNTLNTTINSAIPNGVLESGVNGGDTINVFGDFTQTSLDYNTITINGTGATDTVNISDLTSAHRIVFNGNGGFDNVIGTLRPQDVFDGVGNASNAIVADHVFRPMPTGFGVREFAGEFGGILRNDLFSMREFDETRFAMDRFESRAGDFFGMNWTKGMFGSASMLSIATADPIMTQEVDYGLNIAGMNFMSDIVFNWDDFDSEFMFADFGMAAGYLDIDELEQLAPLAHTLDLPTSFEPLETDFGITPLHNFDFDSDHLFDFRFDHSHHLL